MDFRQNTRNLLSLSPRRLLATGAALFALVCAPGVVHAVGTPPSTWVALGPLPGSAHGTVFGLAVDPTNTNNVVAGDSAGAIYRSADAGTSWTRVYAGKGRVLTITFDPLAPSVLLAGTLNGGAVMSKDSGAHWSATSGLESRSVNAVAFARDVMFAATDHGVYTSADGARWSASALNSGVVQAIAVLAINNPVRVVAGGASSAGTLITKLAAGPVPQAGKARPLIVGTNTGLFISADNASSFTALSGAQLLPSVDYTQAAFTASHFDRFYVASDGGGSAAGGVWATADSGQHFSSLQPPT